MTSGFLPALTNRASATQPRYSLVARALAENIGSGRYPVGSLLPTEFELCKQFGVSRTTLREATRWLRDRGMVSGKAGVGTIVLARHPASQYVHAVESISDVFQYAKGSLPPVIHRIEEREAGVEDAEFLRCVPGQRWLVIDLTRTFVGDDTPILYARVYVPQAYAGIVRLIPARSEPIYTLLQAEYGEPVLGVEQEFRSVQVEAEQARVLGISNGAPGLSVTRHYFGSGERLLLVTASCYRSDCYSYRMRLNFNPRPDPGQTEALDRSRSPDKPAP